jgi:hypothetical protein
MGVAAPATIGAAAGVVALAASSATWVDIRGEIDLGPRQAAEFRVTGRGARVTLDNRGPGAVVLRIRDSGAAGAELGLGPGQGWTRSIQTPRTIEVLNLSDARATLQLAASAPANGGVSSGGPRDLSARGPGRGA